MLYDPPNDLSDLEKEILVLSATLESINNMVNYGIFMQGHGTEKTNLIPETSEHQQLFSILLLDFLSLETFEPKKADILEKLVIIGERKLLGFNSELLLSNAAGFQKWLNSEVGLDLWGEPKKFWFPSIEVNISLKITRIEFLKICGNMSKHNHHGLSRQALLIQKIFERSGTLISTTDAYLSMEDFYEQFQRDLYVYHLSTIAEFLNNIRWGIYLYTRKFFKELYKPYWDDVHKMDLYKYEIPPEISNKYIRTVCWNLLNDVRKEPYFPRFTVTDSLKSVY